MHEAESKKKYLIIGGVAGGATAAARIRRLSEQAEIILLERGEHISYANCGLPYYIGGVIQQRDRLFVQTPAAFARRFNIDVRTQSEATSIDPERQEVSIRRADGSSYTERYDELLLSLGLHRCVPSQGSTSRGSSPCAMSPTRTGSRPIWRDIRPSVPSS